MERLYNQGDYVKKIENIHILESTSYKKLELKQNNYKDKINLYKKQKDQISKKIRMLEVYQNLWGDFEAQMAEQSFLNEEFWKNIHFNILKYEKFIEELNQEDYNSKVKKSIDKKVNREIWNQNEQFVTLIKNDISYMNRNFNKMHGEIHKRSLLQRECLERHISVMQTKYEEVEGEKQGYRQIFYEIQKELGVKGNKISRQSLKNYKIYLLEQVAKESDKTELDLAW